uniref:Mitochondrial cytochrome c oxidase subunit 6c n=1 Tax=Pseudodiaptomus poplesia TaxID=213370 RepID=A0A1S6GL29_9MAXI|nr:mitochondrial cytochrome c oxidase subunit 6c [Pseudodiaptomus poplesia]
MSSAVARIVKPNLRNLHVQEVKRNLLIATGISTLAGVGWYFAIIKPRKDNYARFYKTYDAQADFERMKAAGVFQSC